MNPHDPQPRPDDQELPGEDAGHSAGAAASAPEPDSVPVAAPAPAAADEAYQPGSAAQAAAEFVARIFADVAAPEAGAPASAPAAAGDAQAEASSEAAAPQAPVPEGRPGEHLAGLQGRRVLILGLGASGLAMARWCVRCGADVTVADTREAPPQRAVLEAELPQVRFIAGAFDEHLVQGHGLHAIYRSPGLSPATIAPVFVAAGHEGVRVTGELRDRKSVV